MQAGVPTIHVGLALVLALATGAGTATAQQGRGGTAGSGVQCPGCDSAQMAVARRRWLDSEISALTLELARNRILYENLQSRLAPDSPEPPRSDQERAELRARLAAQSNEMARLMRELSVRCGEQEPVRGYLGVVTEQTMSAETTPTGRSATSLSYHVVQTVQPGSPAGRAGLQPGDTIVAVNRADARVRSLEPYVREPGARLTLTVAREGQRRDIAVTVGRRPPSFDGACMQYRDFRFMDSSGRNVVMYRQPGSAQGTAGRAGTVGRSATSASGQRQVVRTRVDAPEGQQPVRIVLSPDSAVRSTFMVLPPAGAEGGVLFLFRGGSSAVIAGAEVSLVNGGLKTIFAVDHGALVLSVAPRSPAEQAGILSGDVIVSANGEQVTALSVLQRVIHAAHEKRQVSLDIIRAKQPRQITLRW